MKIIVIGETSGKVREVLRARGHDAYSLDILPAKDNSPNHIMCDMFAHDYAGYDGMVFHPTCTYLTISAEWAYADPNYTRYPGVGYHQKITPNPLTGGGTAFRQRKRFKRRSVGHEFTCTQKDNGKPGRCTFPVIPRARRNSAALYVWR